jgi:hypothetical protein
MKIITIPFLRYLFLPILRISIDWGGENSWRYWGKLTKFLARVSGKAARFLSDPNKLALEGMMQLTDFTDGLIGVQGKWEITGINNATKIIDKCPLAEQLNSTPQFCTKLGVIMGLEAFDKYAPEFEIQYEIPTTLSKGNLNCQYILKIKPRK